MVPRRHAEDNVVTFLSSHFHPPPACSVPSVAHVCAHQYTEQRCIEAAGDGNAAKDR